LKTNGSYPITLKTLQGQVHLCVYRLKVCEGISSNYVKEIGGYSGKSYESEGLRHYVSYYSTKLSYAEVSKLCRNLDGLDLVSAQRIHQIVLEQASKLKIAQESIIEKTSSKAFPKIDYEVDIYDASSKEIYLYEDGIGVREQKQKRDKVLKESKKRYYTDLIMLEKRDGKYKYIVAGEGIVLDHLLEAEIKQEYGRKRKAIPIICFSDGASNIRKRLESVLGQKVKRILDWYHLQKKLWQLMSMIATNKPIKQEKTKEMLAHLWKGQTKQALEILTNIKARNEAKKQELISYLNKHEQEIINYEKRKEAGKKIGSGRVEKGADLVVGIRQKAKSMSWCKMGSNALALISAHFLNENIRQFC